ncbi:MAG TPA: glycosyltransferase family 39 protein [Solirubrobacterales bacterium]|jgi:4-amino-4-deoxy-L-arabinose transferase-like glycosyltransferase|nr:glycosyltransferase family 39 protein [Solirubrobacterales bacterium]
MPAIRRLGQSPHLWILAGIVALGAVLRFATLDLQSYRYDEAVTVGRVLHPSFFDTFSEVPNSESTPPLYYLVAWLWTRPFGTGEVWLRSLSALAGTASIAVVYLGAVALPLPRRAGLIAAAAVAVSPVLIWFSQDARAYALVFLLTALSFLFFARARRGGGARPGGGARRGSGARRDLAWWALSSALALATHYFAGFVIVPEAVLLLLAGRPAPRTLSPRGLQTAEGSGERGAGIAGPDRRKAALAVLGILAMAALLLPIALQQRDHAHAGWIAAQPIGERLERATAKLVGGDNGDEHGARQPGPIPLGVPLLLALAALALLLWRGDPEERRGAGIAASVGGGAVALPLLLAAAGSDYFDGRNMLPAFAPLSILLGAGFGVRRAGRLGIALASAFCICSLIFTLEIDRLPRLQREDLRNAASEVGALGPHDAVVANRYAASQPLRYYLGAEVAKGTLPALRQIDLVGSAAATERAGHLLPPAFHRAGSGPVSYDFTLTRYRASRPVRVSRRALERGALVGGGGRASVLIAPSP